MNASRIHILLASLMGGGGVILWSMAAHGPASPNVAIVAQMLLLHACAVLAITACRKQGLVHDRAASLAVSVLILGAVLFAGDLALRAFAGQRLFPGAAPIGGVMLIAGWLLAGLSALLSRRSQ